MEGSKIYLMLVAGWKSKLPPVPSVITTPTSCASYHMPIAMEIQPVDKTSTRAKEVLLTSPHRRKSKAGDGARKLYEAELPWLAAKIRSCG